MLDGETFDDLYCGVFIAFGSLLINGSDNVEMTLEEFAQLGVAYWEGRAPKE